MFSDSVTSTLWSMNFDFEQMFRHVPTNRKRVDLRPTSTIYLFCILPLLVKINKEIIEISLAMPPAEEKLQHPSSEGWPWMWRNTTELWSWRSNVRFIDSGFVDGRILDNIIQLQRNILFPGQIYDLRFLIPGEKDTGL